MEMVNWSVFSSIFTFYLSDNSCVGAWESEAEVKWPSLYFLAFPKECARLAGSVAPGATSTD